MTHIVSANGITRKIPPYLEGTPAIWFQVLEILFCEADITDSKTKYMYAVAGLSADGAALIPDLLMASYTTYDQLKLILIERTEANDKYSSLCCIQSLGFSKLTPSELWDALKGILPHLQEEEMIKLWKSKLPIDVQAIIGNHMDLPIEKQIAIADSVFKVYRSTANPEPTKPTVNDSKDKYIGNQISEILQKFNVFEEKKIKMYETSDSESDDLCYYHNQFGSAAFKCESPCKMNYLLK